jgi:hypothetical protein
MKLLNRERSSIERMILIGKISVILPQLEMVEQMEDIATLIQRR